jgi:PPOX class probable F420-dependent enzyme
MSIQLPGPAKDLLDAATPVTMSTINSDGSPHSTIVWAKRDGDDILISTIVGRVKERNMRRDPRISVLIADPADALRYFSVNGTVSMTTDGGPELIEELSQKYDGKTFTDDRGTDRVRVVVRVAPQRVIVYP